MKRSKSESIFFVKVAKVLNIFSIICSILILSSLSLSILYDSDPEGTASFLHLQLIVCTVFLLDWGVRFSLSDSRRRFLAFNWIILLVSIPYLNIIHWFDLTINNDLWLLAKGAPLIRGFYALYLITTWMRKRSARAMVESYLFALLGFTYLSALIFFAVERDVNPAADTFGNCLWWAFMNVTTVGANIFAQTTIGKVLSVMLPFSGMIMLPLFTAYALEVVKTKQKRE